MGYTQSMASIGHAEQRTPKRSRPTAGQTRPVVGRGALGGVALYDAGTKRKPAKMVLTGSHSSKQIREGSPNFPESATGD